MLLRRYKSERFILRQLRHYALISEMLRGKFFVRGDPDCDHLCLKIVFVILWMVLAKRERLWVFWEVVEAEVVGVCGFLDSNKGVGVERVYETDSGDGLGELFWEEPL